jgi:hypothetical protein
MNIVQIIFAIIAVIVIIACFFVKVPPDAGEGGNGIPCGGDDGCRTCPKRDTCVRWNP